MRVCLVYDCLFPWTLGGHERYLRGLAEQLAARGHAVTFATSRQWSEGSEPDLDGVAVEAISRREPLYDAAGRRRILQAVRFGLGAFRFLRRNRKRFDVVHLVAFPYFSVLAARLALAGSGTAVLVDWPEVWTRAYWREYLGWRGSLGYLIQRLCVALTPRAFVFSALHGQRLVAEGFRGSATRVPAPIAWAIEAHAAPVPARPLVLFVGRMIPEKRATLVPEVIAVVRERLPDVRGLIVGDGPDREAVLAAIRELGLDDCVAAPGFVESASVYAAFEQATCLLAPSSREGFGIVALEANAAGTPVIAVAGPDNALTEWIDQEVNGMVVAEPEAQKLAEAVVAVYEAGQPMRDTTAARFEELGDFLSPGAVVDVVLSAYRTASP
ncbi:MAG: glycosyltransferase [Solirubrobacteraceae bacterium]